MRRFLAIAAISTVLVATCAHSQTSTATPAPVPAPAPLKFVDMKNVANASDADAQKAAQILDRMVSALGGERWMSLTEVETEGRSASFYHGNPSGGYTLFFTFHRCSTPDRPDGEDRVELTKKRNILEIVQGKDAWEVTFQGKHRMEKEDADAYFRHRAHSIEQLIRVWLKRPGNVVFYGGRKMTDSHLADEVTVLDPNNDGITLLVDVDTHLPRKRTFTWRDPIYKDKNVDDETYDDWHLAQGLPSSYLTTSYKNGEMDHQRYLSRISYNNPLGDTFFDADVAAAQIAK
jgi:hypothetical protein